MLIVLVYGIFLAILLGLIYVFHVISQKVRYSYQLIFSLLSLILCSKLVMNFPDFKTSLISGLNITFYIFFSIGLLMMCLLVYLSNRWYNVDRKLLGLVFNKSLISFKSIILAISGILIVNLLLAIRCHPLKLNDWVNSQTWLIFFVTFFSVALYEELLFRGLVLNKIQNFLMSINNIDMKKIPFQANVMTTLLFLGVHMDMRLTSILWLISATTISLTFGYIKQKTDAIWIPALLHALFNTGLMLY